MANVLVNESSLTAIGNAIREKNGETTLYKPAEMATAIQALTTGGGGEIKVISASQGSVTLNNSTGNLTISNENFPNTGVDFILTIASNSTSISTLVTKYSSATNKFDVTNTFNDKFNPVSYNAETHTLTYQYSTTSSIRRSSSPEIVISFVG